MWTTSHIKKCETLIGEEMLLDGASLFYANQDFGHIAFGEALAMYQPDSLESIQKFLKFASEESLPVTIRANGLSQSGQSLAIKDGLSLDVTKLNNNVQWVGDKLNVGCGASWKQIVEASIERERLPFVVPYNTALTLGGVLSVGGLGGASFKDGIIAAHVDKFRVIIADGSLMCCDRENNADLFDACLSGAGLFGIIYDVQLALRPCRPMISMITLTYTDHADWLSEQMELKKYCDYLEAVILSEKRLFETTIAIEYDNNIPSFAFLDTLNFAKMSTAEQMPILDYIYKHDKRLKLMHESPLWTFPHPWYECYIDSKILSDNLDEIIDSLDGSLGGLYRVFPVALKRPRYFIMPDSENLVTFNVLTPGVEKMNINNAIESLLFVDKKLRNLGGKRYISGWFDVHCEHDYWSLHYGDFEYDRQKVKTKYDPNNIFCSKLFS